MQVLLPEPALAIETITSGYQYRFSETGEWQQASGLPFNFSDKTGDKVYIKRSIPDGPTHLFISKAFGKLTLRLNGSTFYEYGQLDKNGYLDPRGYPFHLVKIPEAEGRVIEFIVEGKSTATGIEVLKLGSEKELYRHIIKNDTSSTVFGCILIFIALSTLIVGLKIKRDNRRLFLVFSLFAFSSGWWIISTTFMKQVLYDNTAFWHYADYGLKSISAMSMAMFIDLVLGPGFLKLNRRIWQVQIVVFLYFLLLCFSGGSLFEFNNLFNILVFIYFIIWIPFFIYKSVKRNFEARFLLSGIVVFFVVALLDSLFAAGIIEVRIPATFGILAFVLCFGLILVVRLYEVFRSIESYSLELEKADKLKDDFLANTSHELLTPLNGIIGLADSLVRGVAGKLPEEALANLKLIKSSGRRLSNLVFDLLDLTLLKNRELTIKKDAVSMQQLADVVIRFSRTLVKNEQVTIINSIPSDLPAVLGDEDRLQQVLFNLIGNAIKFTTEGSITVSAETKGDKIAVIVEDTGVGIPEADQDAVFESFKKVGTASTRENQGIGLGLSVTKQLIELHGGSIELSSVVGKGTRFTITLPRSPIEYIPSDERSDDDYLSRFMTEPVELPALSPVKVDRSSADKEGLTILVVDDDPVNRAMMVNQLSIHHYNTLQANNGHEAISIMENEDKPDIILLDLMMPDINGYEVTRILRKEHSIDKLPIILVTAKNRISDFVKAFESGVNDYISKPVNNEVLISRIQLHEALLKKNRELNAYRSDLENLVKTRTAELEKSLEEANLARDEARLASSIKTKFLTNISHELRTPMQAIIGFSKWGLSKGNALKVDKALEYFKTIYSSASRLMNLLNDILDISKLESGKYDYQLRSENLSQCAMSALEEQSLMTREKRITLDFKKPDFDDNTLMDASRMIQVIRNLVANAIKFSEPGGTITLRIDKNDSRLLFSISDNGVGIPEDELELVFDKFTQSSKTKSNAGGSGLGLSICREIILAHNGSIWAENNPDGGSIFRFQIPIR